MGKCGKPTLSGKPCGWHTGPCPHHAPRPKPGPATAPAPVPPAGPADSAHRQVEPAVPLGEAPEELRAFGWWVIRGLLGGAIDERKAAVLVSAARLVAGLEPDGDSLDEALAATVLRGRVMHGLPPQGQDQWAMAASLFTLEAMAELRRWEQSVEGDLVDNREPLSLLDGAALHPDLPLVGDVDEGVRE